MLFLGPPGVGKTHLSLALGLKACEKRKRVLFTYTNKLIEQFMAARVNGSFGKKLQILGRLELLIIDELGYLPINKEGDNLFFQLISKRYEKGSIIISSNKPFEEWGEIFCDDVIASLPVGRQERYLTGFCIIVILLPLMALAIEQRRKWELRVITKGGKIKWERGSIFNGN